jgi:hypothetical protein
VPLIISPPLEGNELIDVAVLVVAAKAPPDIPTNKLNAEAAAISVRPDTFNFLAIHHSPYISFMFTSRDHYLFVSGNRYDATYSQKRYFNNV